MAIKAMKNQFGEHHAQFEKCTDHDVNERNMMDHICALHQVVGKPCSLFCEECEMGYSADKDGRISEVLKVGGVTWRKRLDEAERAMIDAGLITGPSTEDGES